LDRRPIGSLAVSTVGLGCNNFGWRLDEARSAGVIGAALDAGIDFLDTADLYGGTQSEEFLGRALAAVRERVTIATKFGWQLDERRKGASPAYVRRAVEDSLRRLRTDRIDLYQLHRPDPAVPIAETLGALDELVRAGKVREIGCSNFSAEALRAADAAAAPGAARFASVQNEYSLLQRAPEAEVLPECERLGLAFLPYFPLASGLLTGKYRLGVPPPEGTRLTTGAGGGGAVLGERSLARVEALARFAEARGRTLLELAFSWLLSRRPVASVIAGATSPAQVRANAAAAGWALTGDELATVDALLGAPAPV
jgi:aryl-alcohol dehydrogenase-like predicted oxidoreductase